MLTYICHYKDFLQLGSKRMHAKTLAELLESNGFNLYNDRNALQYKHCMLTMYIYCPTAHMPHVLVQYTVHTC